MVEVVINSVEAAALQRLLLGGTLHVKKKCLSHSKLYMCMSIFPLSSTHTYREPSSPLRLFTVSHRAEEPPSALRCVIVFY